ncbi:MAG: efflux RND transporter periplasmic adaptor subunit [Paracoccaceae bacterium]
MRQLSILTAILALGIAPASVLADDTAPLAKIIEVDTDSQPITRRFFGRIAARETVDLAFQVGGQLTDFPVREGETVAEGALIGQLDQKPFELALNQARAQQEQADRTVDRLSKLSGGAATRVSIDDAQTAAILTEIATERAQRDFGHATLRSPFDALVATRLVAKYTTIGPGTPVVRLHDLSELHVEIDVPEVLFQTSNEDRALDLWAEFPGRKEKHPLVVLEYAAETSDVGQTINVTLAMEPPEGQVITPGASVTVFAQLRAAGTEIEVPLSAIVTKNDGTTSVMVFEPSTETEGVVRQVPVTIAPSDTGATHVLSGLKSGQQIVATGGAYLSDGQTVRVFQGFPK